MINDKRWHMTGNAPKPLHSGKLIILSSLLVMIAAVAQASTVSSTTYSDGSMMSPGNPAAGNRTGQKAAALSSNPAHPAPTYPSDIDMGGSLQPEILEGNADVEEQIQGDYPTVSRQESLPLGAIQRAWDQAGPQAGVYVAHYHPHEVIRLRVREFMTTTVIFPDWEKIERIIVGDQGTFVTEKLSPHVMLIRLKHLVGMDTTITAIGRSGLVYAFYVRGEGYNSRHISDVTVYVKAPHVHQLTDKREQLFGKHRAPVARGEKPISLHPTGSSEEHDYLEQVIFDPSELSFQFAMAGDVSIAPDRVYSDGVRTWFDYGNRIRQVNLPTIYNVVDGIDTPINVVRVGNKLVAHASGAFTLRNGQRVVCVQTTEIRNQMSEIRD